MYDEVKSIALKDGREIRLNDEFGQDDDDVSISIIANGVVNIPVDVYDYGYGGGCIMLSPSEKYLLFSYYSGQSQELYTLFELGNSLEPIFHLYGDGEAADYCFSPDEKQLIQVLPAGCCYWWGPWDYAKTDEDWQDDYGVEKDENGREFFVFGWINILDIDTKTVHKHTIRIYPPENWQMPSEDDEYDPMTKPQIIANVLHVHMPWGKETFALPLAKIIAIIP